MDWVDKPQNYNGLYGIFQPLQGSHFNNFPLKTLKLCWIAYNPVEFQLKCLDFPSNQYRKLAPVLSRFCKALFLLVQALIWIMVWAFDRIFDLNNEREIRHVLQTPDKKFQEVALPYRHSWLKVITSIVFCVLVMAASFTRGKNQKTELFFRPWFSPLSEVRSTFDWLREARGGVMRRNFWQSLKKTRWVKFRESP